MQVVTGLHSECFLRGLGTSDSFRPSRESKWVHLRIGPYDWPWSGGPLSWGFSWILALRVLLCYCCHQQESSDGQMFSEWRAQVRSLSESAVWRAAGRTWSWSSCPGLGLTSPFIAGRTFLYLSPVSSPGEGNGNPLQYSCLETPLAEEPGTLQCTGSRRDQQDWATSLSMHWRRKWQPTPVFLPGESQDGEPGGLPSMGSYRVGHDWSDLAAAAAAVLSSVSRDRNAYPVGLSCELGTVSPVTPTVAGT